MKKTITFLSLVIFTTTALLQSCESHFINNEYLGKLPSLAKRYQKEFTDKEEAIKKCTDMQEAFKLDKENLILREKYEEEIKEFANASDIFERSIPFEGLKDQAFAIESVKVKDVNTYGLNLVFNLDIKKDIGERRLFFYFKAIDVEGMDIQGSKSVAMTARIPLTAGVKCEAIGTWKILKTVVAMEHFAKLIEITQEEYDAK